MFNFLRSLRADNHDGLHQASPITITDEGPSWMSFAPQIDPQHPQWVKLVEACTPFRLAIDFRRADMQNGRFLVTEEIGLEETPTYVPPLPYDVPSRPSQQVWELVSRSVVRFGKPTSDSPLSLIVNETPITPGRLMIIEPTSGPWQVRVRLAQLNGVEATLRYLYYLPALTDSRYFW